MIKIKTKKCNDKEKDKDKDLETKTNQFAVDEHRNHFDPLLIGYSARECHPSTHLLQTARIYPTIFFSMATTSREASPARNSGGDQIRAENLIKV